MYITHGICDNNNNNNAHGIGLGYSVYHTSVYTIDNLNGFMNH